MEKWLDIARENRTTAAMLSRRRSCRSAVSRAYYAVYSRCAQEFTSMGLTFPEGREGPNHRTLPAMVETHLSDRIPDSGHRRQVRRMVARLYDLRVYADYQPSVIVEEKDMREAVGLMEKVFRAL